jgi:predicted nucleotidyltransferase
MDTVPQYVALGDVNGDQQLDVVVTNKTSKTLTVLLGDGKGGFNSSSSLTLDGQPGSVALGDFNGDGQLDIAATTTISYYSYIAGN